jgi:hypothetical protein
VGSSPIVSTTIDGERGAQAPERRETRRRDAGGGRGTPGGGRHTGGLKGVADFAVNAVNDAGATVEDTTNPAASLNGWGSLGVFGNIPVPYCSANLFAAPVAAGYVAPG